MRTHIRLFLLLLLLPAFLTSCEDECGCHKNAYTNLTVVNIVLNTDMPPYQLLLKQTKDDEISNLDIRFIVAVYTSEGKLQETKTVSFDDITQTNYPVNVTFSLRKQAYRLVVWSDYVDHQSTADRYYNTQNLKNITPIGNYLGNTQLKDAYTAYINIDLNNQTEDPVKEDITVKKPFAKYQIIANDLDKYILQRGSNPENIRTNITYTNLIYNSYNAVAGQPGGASTGSFFRAAPQVLSTTQLLLGWDYVWADENESVLNTSIVIYDETNAIINTINNLTIPCVRNKLTTITGAFLSQKGGSGVGIITDYEGDINVSLP